VPLRCPVPYIVTVHDLILHRFPNNASVPMQKAYRFLLKRAVSHAQSVLTVSSFVAEELKAEYGAGIAQKLQVTFEGVNAHFSPRSDADIQAVQSKHGLTRPYFFYIGNAKQHKNVPMLLEAFAKASLPDMDLILISGGAEAKQLQLPENARLLSGISDDDLPALYGGAKAFVTASLYEGFCLPAAEALACGCPVIAVNGGPLPEVTGGKALLIAPTVEAFAQAFAHPPLDRTPHLLWDWKVAADKTAAVIHAQLMRS
jgi:glycosyltransferase involved in cell wall biosynthesis